MSKSQTNLLNKIFSQTDFGKQLFKGVQSFLNDDVYERGFKVTTSDELWETLRARALRQARYSLQRIEDAHGGDIYEFEDSYGIAGEDFFENIGEMIVSILPLGITLEEVDSNIEAKIIKAIQTFHVNSAGQYLNKLMSGPCQDSPSSEILLTRIFEHLESADSTVQEGLDFSIKSLLELGNEYDQDWKEEQEMVREDLEVEIKSLQDKLASLNEVLK